MAAEIPPAVTPAGGANVVELRGPVEADTLDALMMRISYRAWWLESMCHGERFSGQVKADLRDETDGLSEDVEALQDMLRDLERLDALEAAMIETQQTVLAVGRHFGLAQQPRPDLALVPASEDGL